MTPSIAPLKNVKSFLGLVENVQGRTRSLPGMAVFHGPSGWGKTFATTVGGNKFQAVCVQAKYSWTPTYFMQSVMKEMGLSPVRGVAAMVDTIGQNLVLSDKPLIIDDAQYLFRSNMIQLARDIYESSLGTVVLVGEEELPQKLTKYENIHNRILTWESAQPCDRDDADVLAPIYCEGVIVGDDLLDRIVAASGGSIRRVATNLQRVQKLGHIKGIRRVSLAEWGDLDFDTGQPPASRKTGDLSPRGSIALVGTRKGARRA